MNQSKILTSLFAALSFSLTAINSFAQTETYEIDNQIIAGNFDIGVANPADNQGSVPAGGSIYWRLAGNSTINANSDFLGTTDGNPLVIKTDGTERMRVEADGDIGIGNATPDDLLHISNGNLRIDGNVPGIFLNASGFATGIVFEKNSNRKAAIYRNNDDRKLIFSNDGSVIRPDLVISDNGQVGVGVRNPSQQFEVEGAIKVGNTTSGDEGTLRWTGSDFEGYDGSLWQSLTAGVGGSGNMGVPALGTDMFTQYIAQELDLWTPHTSAICDASETFIEIGSSGLGYCIETVERPGAVNFESALITCLTDGKRLPEPVEWVVACKQIAPPAPQISNWTNGSEWTSNFTQPLHNGSANGIGVAVQGNTNCFAGDWHWISIGNGNQSSLGVLGFRCVR